MVPSTSLLRSRISWFVLLAVVMGDLNAEPGNSDLLEAYNRLRSYSQQHGSGPNVGAAAPTWELPTVEGGKQVSLNMLLEARRPVVLVFGSMTCGPFCRKVGALEEAYQEFRDQATFVMVYIRDAHPNDHAGGKAAERGATTAASPRRGPLAQRPNAIQQPTSLEARQSAAWQPMQRQAITFDAVVDTLDDATAYAYAAFPDRLYLVGSDGAIVYRSEPGPHGFLPDRLVAALRSHLAAESKASSPASPPTERYDVKPAGALLFDGKPKRLLVNGYSTSMQWPALLEARLDRYTGKPDQFTVVSAVQGGTPIAKWMDPVTGESLAPWKARLAPELRKGAESDLVVLAQQSLQWAFGSRREGIRGPNDQERITQGADLLERYTQKLLTEGANTVFLATHIYKQTMEPQIANERLALDALMRRDVEGLCRGPDVWEPTRAVYPQGFGADRVHPNELGSEVMAHAWFTTLLAHDGLEVPTWSKPDLSVVAEQPVPAQRRRRQPPAWIIERFDTDGDGQLSPEERAEARRARGARQ